MSGLLAMLGRMTGPEFARFLNLFLPIARKVPFNYVAVIGMVVARSWPC